MLARVVVWDNVDADAVRASTREMDVESGPPEGVPSTGFTFLLDPDGRRAMAIGLFETAEDYAKGDATLNAMDPPGGTFGDRTSVTRFEVPFDVRM